MLGKKKQSTYHKTLFLSVFLTRSPDLSSSFLCVFLSYSLSLTMISLSLAVDFLSLALFPSLPLAHAHAVYPFLIPLTDGKVSGLTQVDFTHATHGNTLQHTATHRNTLQHTAAYCNALQHTATQCNTRQHKATQGNMLQYAATHGSTLQHLATHFYSLQHTATHCNTRQHTATHCQAATHCLRVKVCCGDRSFCVFRSVGCSVGYNVGCSMGCGVFWIMCCSICCSTWRSFFLEILSYASETCPTIVYTNGGLDVTMAGLFWILHWGIPLRIGIYNEYYFDSFHVIICSKFLYSSEVRSKMMSLCIPTTHVNE